MVLQYLVVHSIDSTALLGYILKRYDEWSIDLEKPLGYLSFSPLVDTSKWHLHCQNTAPMHFYTRNLAISHIHKFYQKQS